MTPKKSPSVRSLKKSSARPLKKWKPKAFIGLLFLLGVTVIFSLTKSCHKDPPKPSEQDEEQKRIEHAIQLQKVTAPNGETRLVKTVDGVEFAFRWCPPGEFIMGEFPTHHDVMHNVKLTHGFWLLETEVTQAMWETVMGETIDDKARHKQYPTWPENLKGKGPDYPMYYVTWDDCQDFCEKLSEKLGQTVKLPTEAQWEYACRAGSTGDCPGTLEQIAWYGENHDTGSTHPVAQKQPNAWGFYDMIGNVWEWCSDYYDESYYTKSPPNDPENNFPSEKNVQRGGSWCREDFFCKSGARFGGKSYYLSEDFGFRVALIPDQDPPEIPDAEPASTGDGAVSQETTPQETPKAGDRKVLEAKGIQYAFRWCPPGEFIMGSPWNETKRFSDQHRVILTKGFWLLETEVTQAMWKSIMDHNPSVYREDQNPVEYLDWKECQEFCQKLSEELGQKIQFPTEAQWEYACRAGSTESYAGDLDEMAWYNQNANEKPHEVGQKKPNAWGLYDMHGNVWEWCSDWYDSFYYEKSPRTDPENTTPSLNHVFRGGDYSSPADRCRSDFRQKRSPAYPYYGFGLRVALIPGQD